MNLKKKSHLPDPSRRQFLKNTLLLGAAGLAGKYAWAEGAPNIVPAKVLGKNSPSNTLQIAQIGCGRIGRSSEIPGVLRNSQLARFVAACDIDSRRLALGKQYIDGLYAKQTGQTNASNVKVYADYRELLADKSIDAVCLSVPDHWHGQLAIEAALAGKHIYLQKPASITIAEGRQMADAVKRSGVILQLGSQQRSWPSGGFRTGCELVRNGRIGKLKEVHIGLPTDPDGKTEVEMPVPANLNYDMWLGATPDVFYTEARVHPQNSTDGRPGWMCVEAHCAGMITNWGAHHVDIMQWGLGQELGGPLAIDTHANFMQNDVWTVHETYHVEMTYPGDVRVIMDNTFPNGIRFEGADGWVFCARGAGLVTSSDPGAAAQKEPARKSLDASKLEILTAPYGPKDIRWPASDDHYRNWLEAIIARKDPIAPVDQSARSLEACAAAWIGMKLGRRLKWDPAKEVFVNDDDANAMRARKPRSAAFDIARIMKQAGLA
jgi:predicted dehydrogenase